MHHDMTRRSLRLSILVAAGSAALLSAPLSGCIIVHDSGRCGWDEPMSGRSGVKEERTLSIDHVAGKPLSVQTGNGSIHVLKGGTAKVSVTATVRAESAERLSQTKVRAVRDDTGRLTLGCEFPDNKRRSNEGCSFEVQIPDAVGVVLSSSNGALEIAGLGGEAVLKTSNGAISVNGHEGNVKAETSNGSVKMTGVTGGVEAESSNGAMTLSEVGTPLKADTSSGSVTIRLRDDAAGPVNIDTSNGAVELAVGPGFAGTLKAGTSNGRVTLENLGTVISSVKGAKGEVTFAPQGAASVVETSNGPIKVRRKS